MFSFFKHARRLKTKNIYVLPYSRWTSTLLLLSCLWSPRIFLSLPGPRLTNFYRDASSALLQLVNQWLNFTYSRSRAFRYGGKNTSSGDKNRTHDFRTSRCAGYLLLDHSGDECLIRLYVSYVFATFVRFPLTSYQLPFMLPQFLLQQCCNLPEDLRQFLFLLCSRLQCWGLVIM